MTDFTVALTTIEGIEIGAVGEEWPAATGPFTLTEDHLRSIVASQDDPGIKSPRVKLGHEDPRFTPDGDGPFDGTPVFGKFVNLRMTEDGQHLIGDIAGIPEWAAEVLPYAWPTRSGEWWKNYKSSVTEKEWPMVLTAVALGGIWLPGISSIEDLPVLFTAEGPEGVKVMVDGAKIRAARKKEDVADPVKTSVAWENVRHSFFEDFATEESGRYWWWPHQIFIEPKAVIAEDDDGGEMYYVPYTVSGDAVTWGEPVPVKHQFVDKEKGTVLAGRAPERMFTAAADARPAERKRTNKEVKTTMDIDVAALRKRLGLSEDQLPDDATPEQINEVLASDAPEPDDKPDDNPDNPDEPDDEPAKEDEPEAALVQTTNDGETVRLDKDTYQRLLNGAKTAETLDAEKKKSHREKVVADAIKSGRIAPARKQAWLTRLEADPEEEKTLTSLEPGLIPVDERGINTSSEDGGPDNLNSLFPELQKTEA